MGKDKFTFKIICNYKTRGGVVSGEVHFQTDNDVLSPELLPCGERLYYNGQISSVKFITPEFLSAEHRARIGAAGIGRTHNAETRAKMSAAVAGEKHSQYKGPYIITFKDGHTEEWIKLKNIDGYNSSHLYQVLSGHKKSHWDIVKIERIGSDD